MSEKLWKRIEAPNLLRHIKDSDFCIRARDYISGGGYSSYETNQLISNFKKPISKMKRNGDIERKLLRFLKIKQSNFS